MWREPVWLEPDKVYGWSQKTARCPMPRTLARYQESYGGGLFVWIDRSDFYIPSGQGRTDRYTIVEISMVEGRTQATKQRLIHLLFERLQAEGGLSPADVEITITETPKGNWGFRGQTGDQVQLDYKVDV